MEIIALEMMGSPQERKIDVREEPLPVTTLGNDKKRPNNVTLEGISEGGVWHEEQRRKKGGTEEKSEDGWREVAHGITLGEIDELISHARSSAEEAQGSGPGPSRTHS